MIKANNIVKTYMSGELETQVLKGIDLNIESGEFVSIIGPSGAGKSTLMYQLSLLDHPTQGQIFIDNIEVSALPSDQRTLFRLNSLGYVFQDYALMPELTALENVVLPMLMQDMETDAAYAKAMRNLERVGLKEKADNLPSQLSGGQQQRVSIARAIAHDPKILFADEPTANLDTTTSREILKVFLDLHKAGQTIVMVTHEKEFAEMSERVLELKDGLILSDKRKK
ncbi:MAG: ABC transporter ATP-binding protein [Candidatus Doudnabacteria bacterium]|nr:ABC transporter ATP-binding protein [Candidatus Doudnabacteria bacterium]